MENLIWILIIYFIFKRVFGKNKQLPPTRPPVPERMTRSEDGPLRGPWSTPNDLEDAVERDTPLSGPWDKETGVQRQETKKTEREISEVKIPEAKTPEAKIPEVRIPAPLPPDKKETTITREQVQQYDETRGRQHLDTGFREVRRGRKKKNVNPLHGYLSDRHSLAATFVLGEVINKRGGLRSRSRIR